MKRKLKVLHVASFVGNIGDIANHRGAKYLRDNFLDYEFEITQKEIRSFFWKEWLFNSEDFVKEANTYDLVMIGGGNYFELWVENSKTGTSIDLDIKYIKEISTPIIFYSLGCDIGQGVPSENISKFRNFLDYVTNNDNFFVSVRNDGAIGNIQRLYGNRYAKKIIEIPDGGFFTKVKNLEHCELEKNATNLVINVAGDMPEVRFPGSEGKISYNSFILRFARVIENLSKKRSINYVFVPHIFRDLKTIYEIMNAVNDKVRRKFIKVAPYLVEDQGHDYIFSLYSQSDLILGMRFHSNVCSYALERNVIGLDSYIQITNLYKDIESKEYVEINKEGFEKKLEDKIISHLEEPEVYLEFSKRIKSRMLFKAVKSYEQLNSWLNLKFGGNNNER